MHEGGDGKLLLIDAENCNGIWERGEVRFLDFMGNQRDPEAWPWNSLEKKKFSMGEGERYNDSDQKKEKGQRSEEHEMTAEKDAGRLKRKTTGTETELNGRENFVLKIGKIDERLI